MLSEASRHPTMQGKSETIQNKRGMRLKGETNSMDVEESSRLALLEIGDTIIWHIRDTHLGIAHNSQPQSQVSQAYGHLQHG